MATVGAKPFNRQDVQRRVRHPLHTLSAYIRQYVTLEGSAIALIYIALWFWIGLAIDWSIFKLFGFDWIQELQALEQDQTELAVRVSLLVVPLAGLLALVILKVAFRLLREFRDKALALVLERRFPRELGDRLITAVEMADPTLADKLGYSQVLVDRTIQDAADRVEKVPVREVFNWPRLKKLWLTVAGLTIGLYLVVAVAAHGIALATQTSLSPMDFFWQFNDAAAIWTERNLLLADAYWPRTAHLDVIRFQDTASHPNEMRVGRDEQRPDVMVRAVRWVIADSDRTKARGGWRPLRWKDLTQFFSPELLAKVDIPKDWLGWTVDLDDLDARVPSGILPPHWQGKPVREVLADLDNARAAIDAAGARDALNELLDWTMWTFDKIEIQATRQMFDVKGVLLKEYPPGIDQLQKIISRLHERVEEPFFSRTLRRLVIPENVELTYRGKTTKIVREHPREQDNKYSIGLGDLKESGRFVVRGEDYYTAAKKITLVPPPTLVSLAVDKEEPAYLHYRLQGDQSALKGLRQHFRNQSISVTGDTSSIQVPLGTNVKLSAKADRKLKDGVRMRAPAASEERGAVLPNVEVHVEPDGQTFWTEFKNVVRTIEFNFEFNDEDNVKGRRRVLIKPIDDRAPEVFHVELGDRFGAVVLRKPRFKADPGKSSRGTAAEGFLITPDAILPFRGTMRDDYGLTQGNWVYELDQVEIELIGSLPGSKEKLPSLVLQGSTSIRRGTLFASGFQFLPGAPGYALYGPAYWAWIGRVIEADINLAGKRLEKEERLPLERFGHRLQDRSADELPLNAVMQMIYQKPPGRPLFKEHQLKDEDGFDLRKYLSKLKGAKNEPQLHYQLRLSMEGVDNNVETGPGRGRNETPFTFLVVSESELLVQVGIEEEAVYERLDKAYQKLDKAKVSLNEQISKLSATDTELSLVAIRVEEIRKALSDTASVTREVYNDYNRILKELEVNRVNPTKLSLVENKILKPLSELVEANFGKFHTTEEAANKLFQGIDEDAKAERRPLHTQNALQTRDQLDSLLLKMREVLDGMFEGVTFNQLLDLIVAVEREQREASQLLRLYHDQVMRDLLQDLTKPRSK